MNRDNNSEQASKLDNQINSIPHSIEVLIKKASVDQEFRQLLLEKRADAAKEIDLELSPTEAEMLAGIPREQLDKIIDNTKVPPEQKPVFLSSFGKIMLATVVAGVVVVGLLTPSLGHTLTPEQRDRIYEMQRKQQIAELLNDVNDPNEPEANSNITDSEAEENGK
jgi:hypothetical protein